MISFSPHRIRDKNTASCDGKCAGCLRAPFPAQGNNASRTKPRSKEYAHLANRRLLLTNARRLGPKTSPCAHPSCSESASPGLSGFLSRLSFPLFFFKTSFPELSLAETNRTLLQAVSPRLFCSGLVVQGSREKKTWGQSPLALVGHI